VLVQSERNKHAALKLTRKLLKRYAFVPERLSTDDLRSHSAAVHVLAIEHGHQRGRWRNNRAEDSHQQTRRRERKMVQESRFGAESSSTHAAVYKTLPSTTPLTSNAISPRPKRTARFAPRRWTPGAPRSQRPDNS
jgi:putative transposase